MARILGQLPASTTLPQANKGGRVLGVAPQVQTQNKSIVLPPKKTIGEQVDTFTSQPTFKASVGGAKTILPNIAKTAANIPSSAARLARDTVAPINPLDINSPINIGANIVKGAQTATDIFKDRGVAGGIKDIAGGVADIAKKGANLYTKAGEAIYSGLEKRVMDQGSVASGVATGVADAVSGLAKVGIEDPLFIPSLIYAPTKVRGTGVTSDVISDISRPLLDEANKLKTVIAESPRTKKVVDAVTPDILTKDAATMRTEKMVSGLESQNNRLKTVGEAFEENTISRKADVVGQPNTVITPADTFVKYNLAPEVTKGTIEMGSYINGTGSLGKIRENVERIGDEIVTKLKDTGVKKNIDEFKNAAIERARQNSGLKESGKVQSTIDNIEKRFDDYKQSYGEDIDITDVNRIRRKLNDDYDPMTQDTSRIIADVSRDFVYNSTPDLAVKKLLQEQGELLSARNYAEKINGTKVIGGRLGNYVMRTLGAMIGGASDSKIMGPLIGAVGGEYAARALQQAQFKSIGAEAKGLFEKAKSKLPQSSKSQAQIISAKTTPKKDSAIDVSNNTTRANFNATAKPNSKGFVNFNAPLKAKTTLPTKKTIEGVKTGDVVTKSIDEATKSELVNLIAYIKLKKPYNKVMEDMIMKLNEKFGIPADISSTKNANLYEKLIEQTKTTRLVPGREPNKNVVLPKGNNK